MLSAPPGDPERFRVHRLIAVLAVALLAAGSGAGTAGQRWLTAAIYVGLELLALFIQARSERNDNGSPVLWPIAAVLDVAASSYVVLHLGPGAGSSLLLLALPVLIWGLISGFFGGLWSAGLAIASCLVLSAEIRLIPGVPEGAGPVFAAPALPAVSLAMLGLFSGLLGRRIQEAETLHRSTRAELERVKLDAETIVARLSRGLLCLDADGRISRLNDEARALLGRFAELRVGRTLAELGSEGPLRQLVEHLTERLSGRRETTTELLLDGTHDAGQPSGGAAESSLDGNPSGLPLEVVSTPVLDHEGRWVGLVVLLADLTQRRAQEEDRRRRDRLAVIGELSAGLAHEIRNSLKPLSGSVELLRRELPAGDASRDTLLEIILREADALENFLVEFLNFARDKKLQMTVVPLERVLGEELESLNALPDGVFRLVRPGRAEPPLWIRADRGCLRQIVRNLGLNALEAGGAPVEVGWRRRGSVAEIFLRDHGSGISDEIGARVYEPFFTTKEKGTGLGLAIARDLADRMGGRIVLSKADGGGTRACLCLPLVAAPAETEESAPARVAEQAA